MKRILAALVAGLVSLAAIVGWSWRRTLECTKPPGTESVEDSSFRLIPSKTKVWPGQEITIMIESRQPGTIYRGIPSFLECWDGEDWVPKYIMFTNGKPHARPYPLPPDAAIPGVALRGPGPERVHLPVTLKPGWYRIRKEFDLETEGAILAKTIYTWLRVLP